MARNYQTPSVSADWAATRETHLAVAMAIHAIASHNRTPEKIWEEPTRNEWDHVAMAVEEYVTHGDFEAEEDGRYAWGLENITLKIS